MRVDDHPDLGRVDTGDPERLLEWRVLGPGPDGWERAHTGVDEDQPARRPQAERVDVPGP